MRWLLLVPVAVVVAGTMKVWRHKVKHGPRPVGSLTEQVPTPPEPASRPIRFDAHLLFAESSGGQIIIDGLADAAEQRT